MGKRTAVIDIGSNSARMVVFERTSRFGFHLLHEAKSRVRISEGAYENNGNLQERAITRALKALGEFLLIAESFKVRKILCVATSAVRDAPNSKDFINLARKELGLNIKVIDGKQEAYLGAIAAANLLAPVDGITIDIGGGSTECASIRGGKVIQTFSLDLGTVRLKELFFDKKRNIQEILAFIDRQLTLLPPVFKSDTAIGIGGSARAISQAIMKSMDYPLQRIHGFEYSLDNHRKFIKKIGTSEVMKLEKLGIKPDRIDTIREGALIFEKILQKIGAKRVITSGAGVREGVFLSDLLRSTNHIFPQNFNPSIKSLTDRFCINPKAAAYQSAIAAKIFDVLQARYEIDGRYKQHLLYAARLCNIGTQLDFYDHHRHSAYMIMNNLEYGFSHQDAITIAMLVRFHKKKLPSESAIGSLAPLLPPEKTLRWLSFILALSESLNADLSCPKISIDFQNETLLISATRELYLAREALKRVQKPAPLAVIFQVIKPEEH